MKKLMNLLRGYAQVRVTGPFPERLLNLCGQNQVQFWGLRWEEGGGFVVRVPLTQLGRMEEMAGRAMCQLQVLCRRGATATALRLAQRLGFLLGLGLFALAAAGLSRCLLVVEVTGNERVPAALILSELQRRGVHPGAYGPGIEADEVANEALLSLPQLSFLAINIQGSRAEVVVREKLDVPPMLDEGTPADVVADADGIITDIQVAQGRPMFEDGAIVAEGEVLISGELDLKEPEGGSVDLGKLMVHAQGTVEARTWRTLEEVLPATVEVKTYTGVQERRHSLEILWGQVDFFENSSISEGNYDKITQTHRLTLFGVELPLGWITTTLREYTLETRAVDQAQAEAVLQDALLARLEQQLEVGQGEILRTDFVTTRKGDAIVVTLLAECQEQIGRVVEREGTTGKQEALSPRSSLSGP